MVVPTSACVSVGVSRGYVCISAVCIRAAMCVSGGYVRVSTGRRYVCISAVCIRAAMCVSDGYVSAQCVSARVYVRRGVCVSACMAAVFPPTTSNINKN